MEQETCGLMRFLIVVIKNGKVEIKVINEIPKGARVMAVWFAKENV